MPALEVAEALRLAPVHAEQVGGPRHVDVEEGAAHQEVRGLGRDVLGELGEALRGDDAGEPALAAAAHQVRHRAERYLARLVGDLARRHRREELRLVDDDEHRVPMVPLRIEEPAEEGGGGAHLLLGVEALQAHDDGDAVLAHPGGDALEIRFGAVGLDDDVAVLVGQRHEVALGVDDALLHPGGALLQQAAQQVRLARPGIPLHQKARGKQLLEVEQHAPAAGGRVVAHVDSDRHRRAFRASPRATRLVGSSR